MTLITASNIDIQPKVFPNFPLSKTVNNPPDFPLCYIQFIPINTM